jgi:D-alanyl-lipoteichoic acid acyltransferase DltB (MBOAT superfamily)
MLFNSFEFLIFMPLVCAAYFMLGQRNRLWLLLVSSSIFYGFFMPKYLLILYAIILIDYFAGRMIQAAGTTEKKKWYLALSVLSNLSILFFFKYSNFLIENINALAKSLHWNYSIQALEIILPIGLSFHTFQSLSYVIDVYRGKWTAEKDLLVYSVYVMYFPQLVAGPIERPANMIPQLWRKNEFDYERVVSGLYLIAQGLFKKCILSDGVALLINGVFEAPSRFGGLVIFLACSALALRCYGDFSGYSDIARGSGKILGIEVMVNFDKPFFATSMTEFWKRWHISLSSWFRDYVYIPLGGSKHGAFRTRLNLMITFVLSGFWHGPSWQFILWGATQGGYVILEGLVPTKYRSENWPKWLGRVYVFLAMMITWIFFRSETMECVADMFKGFFRPFLMGFDLLRRDVVYELVVLLVAMYFFEWWDEKKPFWKRVRSLPGLLRWGLYFLILIVFLFGAHFSGEQFIYFQF